MEKDARAAVRALRRGIELGMTHIDTAEMYGAGRVEEIVGEAIRGLRDRVFLVSKVLPSNASYEGTLRACEGSLRRLGTDRLDLYLLHWREDVPLEETFRALRRLQAGGKIRAWGVSNFDLADLEQALEVSRPGEIACNQVLYHLGERAVEHAILPWCERRGIAIVAYSPLDQGKLPAAGAPGGRALREIATAHGTTPAQVALAFLTRRAPVFAIPKASRVAHVEENAGAAALALPPQALARLEEAFPPGPPRALAML